MATYELPRSATLLIAAALATPSSRPTQYIIYPVIVGTSSSISHSLERLIGAQLIGAILTSAQRPGRRPVVTEMYDPLIDPTVTFNDASYTSAYHELFLLRTGSQVSVSSGALVVRVASVEVTFMAV